MSGRSTILGCEQRERDCCKQRFATFHNERLHIEKGHYVEDFLALREF